MKKIIFGLTTLSLLTISSIASEKADAYKKGCDLGNAEACYKLGNMYKKGNGVARDDYKAAKLYRKACNNGHAFSCTWLGWMYSEGKGVEKNLEEAKRLYKKACDKKDAEGCKYLGDILE